MRLVPVSHGQQQRPSFAHTRATSAPLPPRGTMARGRRAGRRVARFGGIIENRYRNRYRAPRPLHGKVSSIEHDGKGLFQGLHGAFVAGVRRYSPRAPAALRSASSHSSRG